MDQISLRSCVLDDFEPLFAIHCAAWKPFGIQAGTWDESLEAQAFREHFDPSIRHVIQCNQADVGFLDIIEGKDFFYLQNIAVSPNFQRRGIITFILREILNKAALKRFNVLLCVLKENKSARSLYERLGFRLVREAKTVYIMQVGDYHSGHGNDKKEEVPAPE